MAHRGAEVTISAQADRKGNMDGDSAHRGWGRAVVAAASVSSVIGRKCRGMRLILEPVPNANEVDCEYTLGVPVKAGPITFCDGAQCTVQ